MVGLLVNVLWMWVLYGVASSMSYQITQVENKAYEYCVSDFKEHEATKIQCQVEIYGSYDPLRFQEKN